jgi:hypothetical protein
MRRARTTKCLQIHAEIIRLAEQKSALEEEIGRHL